MSTAARARVTDKPDGDCHAEPAFLVVLLTRTGRPHRRAACGQPSLRPISHPGARRNRWMAEHGRSADHSRAAWQSGAGRVRHLHLHQLAADIALREPLAFGVWASGPADHHASTRPSSGSSAPVHMSRAPSASWAYATPSPRTTSIQTWRAWDNRAWPSFYLLDRDGQVRLVREGEGYAQEIEGAIRSLLGLARAGSREHPADDADLSRVGTPEIYFGSAHPTPQDRAQSPRQGEAAYAFAQPGGPKLNEYQLDGSWARGEEALVLRSSRGRVRVRFSAAKLHLVAGASQPAPVRVSVDGGGERHDQGRHANTLHAARWRWLRRALARTRVCDAGFVAVQRDIRLAGRRTSRTHRAPPVVDGTVAREPRPLQHRLF